MPSLITTPVWALFGFAMWTLLVLVATVGTYRWTLIFARRASIAEWRADVPQGSDWSRRAMRAHANCVENLPVFGAIVLVIVVAGIRDARLDALSLTLLAARIAHTVVHVALTQTNVVAAVRFAFFFTQVVCMFAMAWIVTTLA